MMQDYRGRIFDGVRKAMQVDAFLATNLSSYLLVLVLLYSRNLDSIYLIINPISFKIQKKKKNLNCNLRIFNQGTFCKIIFKIISAVFFLLQITYP